MIQINAKDIKQEQEQETRARTRTRTRKRTRQKKRVPLFNGEDEIANI
jgi:hypothetical protein